MERSGSIEVSVREVHPAELSLEGTLLLDVRTPAEFESAHIEGSVSHPLATLSGEEVKRLATNKRACVVICQSGGRSRKAAEKLCKAGIANVQILGGGVDAWEAEGRSLKRGVQTISLERQVRIGAGILVLTGVALSLLVNPVWIWLSVFVGCGLVFAGITGFCGMAILLSRMPWNNRRRTVHCAD